MLFGHLSNHLMDLFCCQTLWTSVLWGSQALPRSTNAGILAHSTWFPKRASSEDMARTSISRWWVRGCPWSQHLLSIHLSLLFTVPKCTFRRMMLDRQLISVQKSSTVNHRDLSDCQKVKRRRKEEKFCWISQESSLKYTEGQSRQRPLRKSPYQESFCCPCLYISEITWTVFTEFSSVSTIQCLW